MTRGASGGGRRYAANQIADLVKITEGAAGGERRYAADQLADLVKRRSV